MEPIVYRIALAGLGNVGASLLSILHKESESLQTRYGVRFHVTGVAELGGGAINDEGLDLGLLLDTLAAKQMVSALPDIGRAGMQASELLKLAKPDFLLEATPVNLKDAEPGLSSVRAALKAGVNVVLANKGPVVLGYKELSELAVANGAGFKYSATVCGGLPVLNIGRRDMIAADISKISGVFNGTSNFIFDALKNGDSFEQAIIEAQNVGAAEADPSLDTGGWDTAFKLLIIANHMLGANISLSDIDVTGIEDITPKMITAENDLGNTIKLVARIEDGQYTVKPEVIEKESFLGSIDGWEMGVEIHSDIYGISYHKLYEKEPIPTAASMMRDAVNIFI